jgi:hypothetical protein
MKKNRENEFYVTDYVKIYERFSRLCLEYSIDLHSNPIRKHSLKKTMRK